MEYLTPISRVKPPAYEIMVGRVVTVSLMVAIVMIPLKVLLFLIG